MESLELEEISAAEEGELTKMPDSVYAGTMSFGDTLNFGFLGTDRYDIRFHQNNQSDNVLECTFSVQALGKYYKITNFEDIKDEFYEIYAISKYACEG